MAGTQRCRDFGTSTAAAYGIREWDPELTGCVVAAPACENVKFDGFAKGARGVRRENTLMASLGPIHNCKPG
jgi:hypothetical protein